jgi:hypothetical protein
MYDLRDYKPEKKYGKAKKGWHRARTYRGELRNGRSKFGGTYQYLKIDFEILEKGVLVPGFFSHKKNARVPDPMLWKMCTALGMHNKDYRDDAAGFFRDVIGRELWVKVVHRYKVVGNRRFRRDRVEDFRPLAGDA